MRSIDGEVLSSSFLFIFFRKKPSKSVLCKKFFQNPSKSLSKSVFLMYSISIPCAFCAGNAKTKEGCAQICSNIWPNALGARS